MQKCAPSPLTTAALTPSGRLMKQVCSCWIKVSLMALRLAGRFSRTGNTTPDCEIRNKSSVASTPETGVNEEIIKASLRTPANLIHFMNFKIV